AEAEAVRKIFARYLELGSVRALAQDLDRRGLCRQAPGGVREAGQGGGGRRGGGGPGPRRGRARGGGGGGASAEQAARLARRTGADCGSCPVRGGAGQACGPGARAALPAAGLARAPERAPF